MHVHYFMASKESQLAVRHAFFSRLCLPDIDEPILIWRAGAADYKGIVRDWVAVHDLKLSYQIWGIV